MEISRMDFPTKKILTLEAAQQVAQAARAEAKRNGWTMVICVVDDGGHLIYLERMDGTQLGSVEVAQQKARTAVLFAPTKALASRHPFRASISILPSPTSLRFSYLGFRSAEHEPITAHLPGKMIDSAQIGVDLVAEPVRCRSLQLYMRAPLENPSRRTSLKSKEPLPSERRLMTWSNGFI
jgi:hypothetical protein